MRAYKLLAVALAGSCANAGYAATIVNVSPTLGSDLTVGSVAPGDDFRNNSFFSSDSVAYILDEGLFGGVQSFLLHYDKDTTGPFTGVVGGSFDILLGKGESFSYLATTLGDLLGTDPANGASYQTTPAAHATFYRGLEPDDTVSVKNTGSIISVRYNLVQGNPNALDNVRFGISAAAVPEPDAWAMMLSGFAFVGGALRFRLRNRALVRA